MVQAAAYLGQAVVFLYKAGTRKETFDRFERMIWEFNIAIENGSFIVSFPVTNGDFP